VKSCDIRPGPPGQQFDERQAPRNPADAAVETVRQLVGRVTEVPFHLRRQPGRFERAFLISRFAAKPDKSQIESGMPPDNICPVPHSGLRCDQARKPSHRYSQDQSYEAQQGQKCDQRAQCDLCPQWRWRRQFWR
jgi:hypothetical protein